MENQYKITLDNVDSVIGRNDLEQLLIAEGFPALDSFGWASAIVGLKVLSNDEARTIVIKRIDVPSAKK